MDEVKKALSKLESWCAYQDRSEFEARKKLQSFHLNEEEIEKIVARLVEQQFLDDARFAESFVNGKFKIKRWGRIKIASYLREHHINAQFVHRAFDQIPEEEYFEVCADLIKRKANDLSTEKDKFVKKSKIIRFLQSRGFELDVVLENLKSAGY